MKLKAWRIKSGTFVACAQQVEAATSQVLILATSRWKLVNILLTSSSFLNWTRSDCASWSSRKLCFKKTGLGACSSQLCWKQVGCGHILELAILQGSFLENLFLCFHQQCWLHLIAAFSLCSQTLFYSGVKTPVVIFIPILPLKNAKHLQDYPSLTFTLSFQQHSQMG